MKLKLRFQDVLIQIMFDENTHTYIRHFNLIPNRLPTDNQPKDCPYESLFNFFNVRKYYIQFLKTII